MADDYQLPAIMPPDARDKGRHRTDKSQSRYTLFVLLTGQYLEHMAGVPAADRGINMAEDQACHLAERGISQAFAIFHFTTVEGGIVMFRS